MSPSLTVVRDAASPQTETVGERIRRLQAEAQQLAKDHVRATVAKLTEAAAMAREVEAGGEAYLDGVRQELGAVATQIESRIQTIEAIASKAS